MNPNRGFCGARVLARRRRRRLKVWALSVLTITLILAGSIVPPREIPAPGKWDNPSATALGVARQYYKVNGPHGDALVYLNRWPEYAAYIRGEVDTPEECKKAASDEDASKTAEVGQIRKDSP